MASSSRSFSGDSEDVQQSAALGMGSCVLFTPLGRNVPEWTLEPMFRKRGERRTEHRGSWIFLRSAEQARALGKWSGEATAPSHYRGQMTHSVSWNRQAFAPIEEVSWQPNSSS